MVPVHLDALWLKTDRALVSAVADFTRLPYFDGKQDCNPDVANISEEIVSQPFQNQNLLLKAGIHLHWALPDALTKRIHNEQGTTFPTVPNRWLVTRTENGSLEKQWIVESDYLSLTDNGSVSFPSPTELANESHQPFCYLGRKKEWKNSELNNLPEDTTAKRLANLTAIGYGEPTFAAFYPNCFSVFGLWDRDYADESPNGISYDLIGWYSDSNQDYLKIFIANFREVYQRENSGKTPTNEEVLAAIKDKWQWTIADGTNMEELPGRMVCYARLTFPSEIGNVENSTITASDTTITVGNTGTEALSAYLAHTIDSGNKSTIEDQLEAVQLSSRLANRQLDVGFKFEEARHEKGFNAIEAGSIWTIRPETETSAPANAVDSAAQEQITLPEEMAHRLNQLNVLQQTCDREAEKLESMRRQLFSDWYKYMLCAYPPEDSRDEYPDIDEVRYYIETKGIAPLQRKKANCARLTKSLKTAVKDLSDRLKQWNQDVVAKNPSIKQSYLPYILKQISAPRFWQPTEPVVLMTGKGVQASLRHGQDGRLREDGLLECHALSLDPQNTEIPKNLEKIRNKIVSPESSLNPIGFSNWTEQPWNLFLLEWEVEVFPVENQSNLAPDNRRYDKGFIVENYELAEEKCDLSVQPRKGAVTKAANVYSGSSVLTPHAGIQLKEQIEAYLKQEILAKYYQDKKVPKEEQVIQKLGDQINDIESWYSNKDLSDSIYTAIRAYQVLQNLNGLSQSLGGFNEALLMHKQTLQLGIADPLGFDDYQEFAEAVREAVENSIRSAPEPLNDFNPIRSGVMKILKLRLVDTFGQYQDLDVSQVMTAEPMKTAGDLALISLPPRLVQPARLNFRWLSASQGEQEMNDHPATTPICGWVLPNNLDNSLMIYDNNGRALGSIDENARWEPAPIVGVPQNQIAKPHLQRMVNYLIEQGANFLKAFISTLDRVVDNIEPENFAQHPGLALLMGSPLALVRASLNLELQGLPAVNQDWNVFRRDMQTDTRETDAFTEVQFPIRIGEYKQLNDGLVGYWQETKEGYKDNIFYAPQDPENEQNLYIRSHTQEPLNLMQSIAAPPQILVMLIDPRGKVHATSGVLPTKAIDIPPDQYATALQQIEITFLSTPILVDRFGQQPVNSLLAGEPPVDQRDTPLIHLPLPGEPGYEWSWVYRERGTWREGSIGRVKLEATFSGQQEIREGWLKLKPAKPAKPS